MRKNKMRGEEVTRGGQEYNSDEGHKRGDGASKGNQNVTLEEEAMRKKEGRKYNF